MKFFNVRIVLCGWHLQRNLVSHFNKVKNLDADLYQKILYLPFVMSVEKFNNTLEEIKDSQHISKKQKDYQKYVGEMFIEIEIYRWSLNH